MITNLDDQIKAACNKFIEEKHPYFRHTDVASAYLEGAEKMKELMQDQINQADEIADQVKFSHGLQKERDELKEKLEKSIVMQIEANERCDVLREKLEIAKEALKKVIECSDAGLGEYYLCSCNVPAQEALEKLK